MTSASLPEGTSDPPQPRRELIAVLLPGFHSWFGSCFDGFFIETSFQIRDGLRNALGPSSAGNFLRGKRCVNAQALRKITVKCRRDFLKPIERHRCPRDILLLGFAEHFADDVMRLTEGNAFADQIVRRFRC